MKNNEINGQPNRIEKSTKITGEIISEVEWKSQEANFLPTDQDRAFVISLMQPVYEPGKMASWIAAPSAGINTQPAEYEYVRL